MESIHLMIAEGVVTTISVELSLYEGRLVEVLAFFLFLVYPQVWYQRFAREEVLVFGVFCHRDVEVAVDALVFLKLQMGPLPVVDKLLECLLQVVEYGIVRALYLSMVDGDFGLQFLCLEAVTTACQPARQ